MKGDIAFPFACPLQCGAIMSPSRARLMTRFNQTARHRIRRALDSHFVTHHPMLSVRERSLLADQLCQEIGL